MFSIGKGSRSPEYGSLIELLASGATLLVLDRLTKRFAETRLAGRSIAVAPSLRIAHVASRRLRSKSPHVRAILATVWLAAFTAALTLNDLGAAFQTPLQLIGVGMALGGAAGNMVDVFQSKPVADFIDFNWWPAFNIADAGIVVGLITAFWPG